MINLSTNPYNIQARYIPAMINSVPFILIGFYFINQLDSNFWDSVWAQAFSGISLSAGLFYLMAYLCRHSGKWLEDIYFKNGADYPTTQFLLDKDTTFSKNRKVEIISKLNKDFKINLKGCTADTAENRLRINEAVAPIRRRFFNNELVLQRNIQFGFARNLAGGAIVAEITSICATILSAVTGNQPALKISLVLCIIYAILICFGLVATLSNSRRYAKALYDEFLLK